MNLNLYCNKIAPVLQYRVSIPIRDLMNLNRAASALGGAALLFQSLLGI